MIVKNSNKLFKTPSQPRIDILELMFDKLPKPFPPQVVIRFLLVVIVVLAYLAGWYHSALQVEKQKNSQLQTQLEEKL